MIRSKYSIDSLAPEIVDGFENVQYSHINFLVFKIAIAWGEPLWVAGFYKKIVPYIVYIQI